MVLNKEKEKRIKINCYTVLMDSYLEVIGDFKPGEVLLSGQWGHRVVGHNLAGTPRPRVYIELHNPIKIGRSPKENCMCISNPAISAIHCMVWMILFDETSIPMYYLRDCSLNGTYINGTKLLKENVAILNDGDLIELCENSGKFLKFSCQPSTPSLPKKITINYTENVDNWNISNIVVGNGTFGYVLIAYMGIGAHSGKSSQKIIPKCYAVKIVKMKLSKLDKEAKILMRLNHPNIIKVFKTHTDKSNNLYIFQELIPGGDLFSYLAKGDCLMPISQTEALVFVYQILHALKYLHTKGIVHRDLKLDNILLCTPEPFTKIVLADFGIAKTVTTMKSRMFTVVGTPEYCAPEVGFKANRKAYHSFFRAATLEQQGYDSKCDLWSLGVITHIMLTGISPFYGDGTEQSIVENAKAGILNFNVSQWSTIDIMAQNFVSKLLEVNVDKRLDCEQCFNHLWISKHQKSLKEIYEKKVLLRFSEKNQMGQPKTELETKYLIEEKINHKGIVA